MAGFPGNCHFLFFLASGISLHQTGNAKELLGKPPLQLGHKHMTQFWLLEQKEEEKRSS